MATMPKKRKPSIFDKDYVSPYGTYDTSKGYGNPTQWAAAFAETASVCLTLPWEDLGLISGSTVEQVKQAYRDLVKLHHPDRGGDSETMKKINTAYSRIMSVIDAKGTPVPLWTPTSTATTSTKTTTVSTSDVVQLLQPLSKEDECNFFLDNDLYIAQEKMDGRRMVIEATSSRPDPTLGDVWTITGSNRKGVKSESAVNDGIKDILILLGENVKLDGELIKDKYYVFDMLSRNGKDLTGETYVNRYKELEQVFGGVESKYLVVVKVYWTKEEKKALYEQLKAENKEGIVFKGKEAKWLPGSREGMYKYKFVQMASVVCMGYERAGKASVGMAVYDDSGEMVHVGNCTISGTGTKGMPVAGDVIEVRYLYYVDGLVQPCYLGIRKDVYATECKLSQLKKKAEVEG